MTGFPHSLFVRDLDTLKSDYKIVSAREELKGHFRRRTIVHCASRYSLLFGNVNVDWKWISMNKSVSAIILLLDPNQPEKGTNVPTNQKSKKHSLWLCGT